ncbi:hypothetical protein Dsin_010185 [Dipteronia sinensis]|uniref:WRKY domain-containing protein n=1 Tax=Dipteronia sinensis TaxID=43782 RepID=A0AAE0ASQ2_9ROSI|nr:hypothetical protein Dsin_010185 [Dipteronia sinensis]
MEDTKENSLLAGDTFEEAGKKTMKHNGDHEEGVHTITQKGDLLKMAKAKMGELREENGRLKLLLAQMLKDYQSLQKNFLYIVKQEEANKKSTDTIFSSTPRQESTDQEEPGLISLSLGRGSSTEPNKKDEKKNQNFNGGRLLSLGLDLDYRFDQLINSSTSTEPADVDEKKKITSSEHSFHEDQLKEEEPIIETWPPPSKNIKTMRNGGRDHEDEQVMEQTHLKKARVSVRARCETTTMNDGCQWRKYGQKTAKGNPCPRAYYRCTVSPNCPVRKQVQRWVEDMSILITTYEGNHNHPLPISATAMASTTSAAASMLQCRSSTSQGLANSGLLDTSVSTSAAANFHGLNFTTENIYNARPHHQFYFPNNYSSISSSNYHPTITLDLTTAPTNYNSSSHFNRLISSSTSNLNFSSPSSSTNYNSLDQPYSSYMQMNNVLAPPPPPPPPHHHHQSTINAATTKVITSNPNFQSALAAAISSYIASKGAADDHQQNMIGISSSGDNNSGLNNLNKWVPVQVNSHESFPIMPAAAVYSTSSAQNRSSTGCASSFLNKLVSSNNNSQQQEAGNYNMSDVPEPSLPFSTSKSSDSGSP